MLNLRLDQMLMAAFLPAQALGLYVVAVAWSGAMHPLISAVGAVVFPRVAAQANPSQQRETFAQGTRLVGVILLVIMMPLILITPYALPLVFGKQFSTAIPVAIVLVFAGAIAGLNTVLEEGLRGLGQPVSVLWAECGGVAVAISSLLILLKPFAILGAAFASLLGNSATALFLIFGGVAATGYSPAALLLPRWHEVSQGWDHMWKLIRATRII
jgi:O-antigen/teichoic acid export membrane protein